MTYQRFTLIAVWRNRAGSVCRNKETTRSPSQAMVVWERLVVEDVVRKGDRCTLDRMWVVRGRGCKGGTRIPR